MEHFTKQSILDDLNKLSKKDENGHYFIRKNTIAYRYVYYTIMNDEQRIRPCYTVGYGKYCRNQNQTEDIKRLLTKLNIEFVLSNDAKRGSPCGNLITITDNFIKRNRLNKLKELE
jgi:hypothetical protein